MSVLVCFHAHPDDEVFSTGGVMRMAADAGHRVVLVTATDGAAGEFPPDLLAPGEPLADRRRAELAHSAELLGVHRLVMLGYPDSGMAGTAENDNPAAFANVPLEEPVRRLADVLVEEGADVLTTYDSNGGYGHPDHIRVHGVGARAAKVAGVEHVFEGVANRDHMRLLIQLNPQWSSDERDFDIESFGVPEAEIGVRVDVSKVIDVKRAAMVAHASQIGDFGPFLKMPIDHLTAAFGIEWFRRADGAIEPRLEALPL